MYKPVNVLSIDWDYFVNANFNTRAMFFPDCTNEDMPYSIQDIIWAGRYASSNKLSKIGVLPVFDKFLNDLDLSLAGSALNGYYPECFVVDSHKHIYKAVKDMMKRKRRKAVNVVNIDFHHDMYGKSTNGVDCGNWVDYLMEDFPVTRGSSYCWVNHSISDAGYSDSGFENLKVFNSLSEIDIVNTKWDLIFLCRSGMWSPPHLDDKFLMVANLLKKCQVTYQNGIFNSRYTKELKKMISVDRKAKNSLVTHAIFLSKAVSI